MCNPDVLLHKYSQIVNCKSRTILQYGSKKKERFYKHSILPYVEEKNEDQKQFSLAWIISNTSMLIVKETQYFDLLN